MPRPSWDEYFLSIAKLVASRSTCLRRKVGAVVVKDQRILATGYNGAPAGLKHCAEVGCLRDRLGIPSGERQEICRGIHAEQNALVQAATSGVDVRGSTIYCTIQPCILCAKLIIGVGITRVVIGEDYPDSLARDLLKEAGIPLEKLQIT